MFFFQSILAAVSAPSEIYLNEIKGISYLKQTFANAYASISTTSPMCESSELIKLSPVAQVNKKLIGFFSKNEKSIIFGKFLSKGVSYFSNPNPVASISL